MSVANGLVDASGWADQRDYTHNRIDPFAAMKQRLPLWVAATCLVGALCQPDVWDGALATQFRSAWPETSRSLQTVRTELEDLRQRVERINADIMAAGGN